MKCTSYQAFAIFSTKRTARTMEHLSEKNAHLSVIYFLRSNSCIKKELRPTSTEKNFIQVKAQMQSKQASQIQVQHFHRCLLVLHSTHILKHNHLLKVLMEWDLKAKVITLQASDKLLKEKFIHPMNNLQTQQVVGAEVELETQQEVKERQFGVVDKELSLHQWVQNLHHHNPVQLQVLL